MRYLWYSMYAFVTALAVYTLFFAPPRHRGGPRPVAVVERAPVPPVTVEPAVATGDVQVAILLDTSSSMDGLIEQARTQLWEIVASLQTDDQDRDRSVTVALYQYGNSRLDKSTGFIEQLSALTPELDAVSIKLHSLSTSGGKEYAPQAILRAVEELAWSDDDAVERVIVIAGNEGFSQGSISDKEAIAAASARGIRVIPIFCANGGATAVGVASWKRAAAFASTKLDTIDPDQIVVKVETPYDADIVKKYQELEKTRLTYGDADFREEVESVRSQSQNAISGKPAAVQADRAVAQTRQAHRGDLVEDYGRSVSVETLSDDALPTELIGLSKAEQSREIAARKARRTQLESEIRALDGKRQGYFQNAPPAAHESKRSLGSSVRATLRGY